MEVLKVVGTLGGIAKAIYDQCSQAQCNKKLCGRLQDRIKLLMSVLGKLKSQPDKANEELGTALAAFQSNLESAQDWVKTYSNIGWLSSVCKANSIYKKFLHINDQLRETAEVIQLLLQENFREEFLSKFKSDCRKSFEEDLEDLVQLIKSGNETMDIIGQKVDTMAEDVQDIKKLLMPKPWDIKEIPAKDLTRETLLLSNDQHDLYKGEYQLDPVLIKDLKGLLSTDSGYVRSTFESECKIMRKYESLNILKLYGISIGQPGTGPHYSLVTEYCEKGTLREVLKKEPNLGLQQRVLMALDAARAVYKIHQTENKAILHGNLNSCKYMVTKSYCLKLSGFEFSKTETSMKRNAAQRLKQDIEWAYIAPETLQSINNYDKCSEIYSLGIVIYEIATGSLPEKGQSSGSSTCKEVKAKVKEGLSDPRLSILFKIIKKCLKEEPLSRPTAGDIATRLLKADRQLQETPMETDL